RADDRRLHAGAGARRLSRQFLRVPVCRHGVPLSAQHPDQPRHQRIQSRGDLRGLPARVLRRAAGRKAVLMEGLAYFFMAWTDLSLLAMVAVGTLAGIYIGA